MRVRLRNPDREVHMDGPRQVRDILSELGVDPDTVLVIRDRALLTREERLDDADEIEIRPVISGGARGGSSRPGDTRPGSDSERTPRMGTRARGGSSRPGDTRPGSDSERTPRWKEGGGRVIGK